MSLMDALSSITSREPCWIIEVVGAIVLIKFSLAGPTRRAVIACLSFALINWLPNRR